MEQIAVGLKDAAASVGLSVWTLRSWIRSGKVRCVRLGRRVLIEPCEMERLVAVGRTGEDQHVYDLRKLSDDRGKAATQ